MQKKDAGNKDEKLIVFLGADNRHRIFPYNKKNSSYYFKKLDDHRIIRVNGMSAIMCETRANEINFEVPTRVICKKHDIKKALEFLYEKYLPYHMALKNEYQKRYFAELDKIQVGIDALENGAYESNSVDESCLVEHVPMYIVICKADLNEGKVAGDFPEFIKLDKEVYVKKDCEKPTVHVINHNDFSMPRDYTDIVFIRDEDDEYLSCHCTDATLDECKRLLLNEVLEDFKKKSKEKIENLKKKNEEKTKENEKELAKLKKEQNKIIKILSKKLAKIKV